MTAKEYLNQAFVIERQIRLTLEKAERMRDCLEYRSPSFEGTGSGGGSHDRIGSSVAKIADYERQADELVDRLIDKRLEIENTVKAVCNPVQREILERRYLLYQPWESRFDERSGKYVRGIADEMGYSRRRIFQLHGEALKKIAPDCIELHL